MRQADFTSARVFLGGLPGFLRHPLDPADARRMVADRLQSRDADFLVLVHRAIYGRPTSPYRRLLAAAGCEYGDLARLVAADGVNGALVTLLGEGVYLTVDEFKGRRPVRRGSLEFSVEPPELYNVDSRGAIAASSGGSRGAGTAVPMDFPHIHDRAATTLVAMMARGGLGWVKAHWHVPGGGVLARLLEFSHFGAPVTRWFSQVDPRARELHPRYRWSARALAWGSRLAGVPLPFPEYVPLDDPLPIARWFTAVLRAGQTPHLFAFASSAVRLAAAALAAGIDVRGSHVTVTGEPLTAARLAAIRRAGIEPHPRYAATECGAIGFGCLAPEAPDDVHVLEDLHAVVQPPDGAAAARPLFVTSLRSTAPIVMLNVSTGDQATMVRRRCDCPLERVGWPVHLHTIRSQEKLTAGGVTLLDGDVIRVLEDVLPGRFGGGPTHYQLVEDEDATGHPRLRLLIDPVIGPVDARAAALTLLECLGAGGGAERVMMRVWREGDLVQVERTAPRLTPVGKILHLHQSAPLRSALGR